MVSENHDSDIFKGSLLKNIFFFALPIMAVNILQLLFNAADMIVVGRFSGSTALAAVGATTPLISLIVNLFIGLSVGTSVVVAQDYGEGNAEKVNQAVHTSILISIIGGFLAMVLGLSFCRSLLVAMGTPDDILDLAVLYMKIYFIGMPASMVFNFSAAILRATGDSRRPTYYLTISGVVNVLLNLFFVIALHMSVAGVALATTISQFTAVVLIIICLLRSSGPLRLTPKKLRINRRKLGQVLRIGLPAGLQNLLFSISNVLVQSAVNSFGSTMVAANSASRNIESFVGVSMNAYYNAAITFTGQSMGAGKYKKIDVIAKVCTVLIFTTWFVLGGTVFLIGRQLFSLYSSDSAIIELGMQRLTVMMIFYFTQGIMCVFPGITRGMGYSISPMISTLIGACLLRILWLATVFVRYPTVPVLFACYPVTWTLAGLGQLGIFFFARHRLFKKCAASNDSAAVSGTI